jgi:hypothetical protein
LVVEWRKELPSLVEQRFSHFRRAVPLHLQQQLHLFQCLGLAAEQSFHQLPLATLFYGGRLDEGMEKWRKKERKKERKREREREEEEEEKNQ